jgi:hypothetical protein
MAKQGKSGANGDTAIISSSSSLSICDAVGVAMIFVLVFLISVTIAILAIGLGEGLKKLIRWVAERRGYSHIHAVQVDLRKSRCIVWRPGSLNQIEIRHAPHSRHSPTPVVDGTVRKPWGW